MLARSGKIPTRPSWAVDGSLDEANEDMDAGTESPAQVRECRGEGQKHQSDRHRVADDVAQVVDLGARQRGDDAESGTWQSTES